MRVKVNIQRSIQVVSLTFHRPQGTQEKDIGVIAMKVGVRGALIGWGLGIQQLLPYVLSYTVSTAVVGISIFNIWRRMSISPATLKRSVRKKWLNSGTLPGIDPTEEEKEAEPPRFLYHPLTHTVLSSGIAFYYGLP